MIEANTGQEKEIVVLSNQDLTKTSNKVKSEIPKYWERDYINQRLNMITDSKHLMLFRYLCKL